MFQRESFKLIMTIKNKVKEEKPQYNINREAGTISALPLNGI